MSKASGTIIIEEVQEHDDGSAMPWGQLVVSEGIRLILTCAAYGVDLEDVYDWIASHKEKDETNE